MIFFWLYGVIFKVVLCMVMIVLSVFFIRKFRYVMKWKDYFKVSLSKYYVNIIIGYGWISIMFVVIVLIYILMELLVGIMVFLFGIEGGESYFFYFLLYFYVGDIIDMIVFFNVILNFFVYFCISK